MKIDKELENAVLTGNIILVKELIKKGVDLESKDKYGRTILYDAIVKGYDEVVKLLCENNAKINIYDKLGKTPLHLAVINDRHQIAKYLIKKGANVNAIDINGNSVVFDAIFNSKGNPDIVIALIEKGADYNIKNNYDISPKDLAESIANFDLSYLFK